MVSVSRRPLQHKWRCASSQTGLGLCLSGLVEALVLGAPEMSCAWSEYPEAGPSSSSCLHKRSFPPKA